MNVLFVSQCEKRAINETRRILDQFAERSGTRTWATPITENGLSTVRKLLKQSARKNTAVACHWVHAGGDFELLWIVGNAAMFNEQGRVPTNLTERDVLKRKDENQWHSLRTLSLLAQMAALWHDFGKANDQFQAKLQDRQKKDAYRHEWVSLRMFQAFVGSDATDASWLERLIKQSQTPDFSWLDRLQRDGVDPHAGAPLAQMPPLARAVGWLVLSHHGLPSEKGAASAVFDDFYRYLSVVWSHVKEGVPALGCWQFRHGAPDRSATWRRRASSLAQQMLQTFPAGVAKDSSTDVFLLTLARFALVLGDHHYSSQEPDLKWQDPNFSAYANTDRKSGKLKQKLDEHLLGVADTSKRIAVALSKLEHELPRLARHKGFSKDATDPRFTWQNRAFQLAEGRRLEAHRSGFFGVNLASTGCGKTIANARIAYALAEPGKGARITIALGLRTLTLQTGRALGQQMGLDDDDLALLVGNAAVRELFALAQQEKVDPVLSAEQDFGFVRPGSASADPIFPGDAHVVYEGAISESKLKDWLDGPQHKGRGNASKLVHAPVLVCTIDHLMPACEATRGGSQLAPMLRLLTSDIVLDEPDDFDLNDLPALSRFVFTCALLGSRVLLSSATLAPALVQGLFEAYRAGRALWQKHCGEPGLPVNPVCAWFDEFDSQHARCAHETEFNAAHRAFVQRRNQRLAKLPVKRRAFIAPMPVIAEPRADERNSNALKAMAMAIATQAQALHAEHHVKLAREASQPALRISIGLVRMANIEPIIAVAQCLARFAGWSATTHVHLCVYHARFPLLMRNAIETTLDRALSRSHRVDELDPFLRDASVQAAIAAHPQAQDHLFLVLASPVAEVGRDHCYDWAIVEPSSMRSIIQLAGRVRRHRPATDNPRNLCLLGRNRKALVGTMPCFVRPGFEDEQHRVCSTALEDLLRPEELDPISASPRIATRAELSPRQSLVDLEHQRLAELFTEPAHPANVRRYWQSQLALSGNAQQAKPFRFSPLPTMSYFLSAEDSELRLRRRELDGVTISEPLSFRQRRLTPKTALSFWPLGSFESELGELATKTQLDPAACAARYATMELPVGKERFAHQDWIDWGPLGWARDPAGDSR